VGRVGLWPAVAIIAAGVLPATLGLILLALPLWPRRRIVLAAGAAFAIAAVGTWEANSHLASNFAKLGAYTCAGWAFLWLFEELGWVLIIALIIPFVDAISVAAGPTKDIVNHHVAVYSAVAVAFLAPGGGAAPQHHRHKRPAARQPVFRWAPLRRDGMELEVRSDRRFASRSAEHGEWRVQAHHQAHFARRRGHRGRRDDP